MNDEAFRYRGTSTTNEKPVGSGIVLIGYALRPLLLSVLFAGFFLVNGKTHI